MGAVYHEKNLKHSLLFKVMGTGSRAQMRMFEKTRIWSEVILRRLGSISRVSE